MGGLADNSSSSSYNIRKYSFIILVEAGPLLWQEIVTTLGLSTLLVSAVSWLARSIVTQILNKDIEKFKLELQKEAFEHQIRYRRVDEKVADALCRVYGRLHPFVRAVKSYVAEFERSDEPSKEEKRQIVANAQREFKECVRDSRLYIPESLYERTATLAQKLAQITNDFARGLRRQGRGVVTEDSWAKAMEDVEREAEPLFSDIVATFQKRLGVVDE